MNTAGRGVATRRPGNPAGPSSMSGRSLRAPGPSPHLGPPHVGSNGRPLGPMVNHGTRSAISPATESGRPSLLAWDDMTAALVVTVGGTAFALAGYGLWWVLSAFTVQDAAALVLMAAGVAAMVIGLERVR